MCVLSPLSLLNVGVKIFAKVLASRLFSVIEDLIHVDQTGFMPGKGMDINVRRLFLNLSEPHDNPGTRVIARRRKGVRLSQTGISVGNPDEIWIWSKVHTLAPTVV